MRAAGKYLSTSRYLPKLSASARRHEYHSHCLPIMGQRHRPNLEVVSHPSGSSLKMFTLGVSLYSTILIRQYRGCRPVPLYCVKGPEHMLQQAPPARPSPTPEHPRQPLHQVSKNLVGKYLYCLHVGLARSRTEPISRYKV